MKTSRIIIIACMVSISSMAFSQGQFALGLKGGVNFASLNASDPGTTYKNRTGYHFGAFALFKFAKIGIQPEIVFSQQGSKVKVDAQSFDANFSYINIPVLLKLYTVAGINLQAGPQFGFLSRAEYQNTSIKDDLKSSDVSVALGAGWDLPFGLSVDLRYNLGITDINEQLAADAIKNQVWQLSVGYKFIKLGK